MILSESPSAVIKEGKIYPFIHKKPFELPFYEPLSLALKAVIVILLIWIIFKKK